MNIDTGEIERMHAGQRAFAERIASGMQQLPKRLSPFAEAHMEENPGKPVDLQQKSALSDYASYQREKRSTRNVAGAFGKCKNRPS